ncbi:hypothetical protein [Nonomuraea jabiensis]|uniref:Lipoprotein n=1 Tax=Nonomuraea jabiensis TaxID=882448 RepID=A0A7W9FYJ6_9ACTN|nr:hypothetical protein [Nonomuraea jabiensis]MBB5773913.1 hypothetical protein [Nonomuraea jabiensis]
MHACRHGLSAVLLCVAAMTACTASEPPTLEDAARQLDSDGGALLTSTGLRLSTDSPVDDDSCVPGQVRRYFRAESDLASASAGLLDRLQAMGYDKVVDDLDLRDGDQDVSVLRNPETRLTFELTVLSGDRPGVRVIGKTTCYATD